MDRKSERGGGDAIVANEKRRVIEKRRFTSTPIARGRDGMVTGLRDGVRSYRRQGTRALLHLYKCMQRYIYRTHRGMRIGRDVLSTTKLPPVKLLRAIWNSKAFLDLTSP